VTTPAPIDRIGDEIQTDRWAFLVEDVRRMEALVWGEDGAAATPQGEFVVVLLQARNLSDRTLSLNAWDFELRNSTGRRYLPASVFGFNTWLEHNGRKPFASPCAAAEQIVTGLLFDVPARMSGLRLRLLRVNRFIAIPEPLAAPE
jgi:hypothetical protein